MKRNDITYTEIVRALHDYNPAEEGCLRFNQGDLIYVQEKDATGWWSGIVGNRQGWFPSNWIEPVSTVMQDAEITTLSRGKQRKTEDDNSELPQFWRRKATPTGDIYYYNTETNETTYDLEQVRQSSSKKRQSLIWTNNGVVVNDSKPLPMPTQQWVQGPRTLLAEKVQITWELLINNILKAIADLNYSAKNDIKANFISQAANIVVSIRDMLACSGTISTDSAIVQNNRSLLSYHQNIMQSLSKIVLAAKVASGIWPPPDSIHSMRYQAGQVLLAVRHFVAVAQDMDIILSRAQLNESEQFDVMGQDLADLEFVARLDQNCDVITTSVAALVSKITRDRHISPALVDQVKKTVTEIGQLLSIVEDIRYDSSLDTGNIAGEFRAKKDHLYAAVNDLVSSSMNGEDGYAPPNALGQMLESSTNVLELVEELLVVTKILIDHKELLRQKMDAADDDSSELAMLQRRAEGLKLSEQKKRISADPSKNSKGPGLNKISTSFVQKRMSSSSPKPHGSDPFISPVTPTSLHKVNQFFGDENAESQRMSDQSNRPWFLRKETTYDLSYNMEGAVNGGTFSALVERLSLHDQPVDPSFASTFLMTFHLFGTSQELLKNLKDRFNMEPPDGLTPDELSLWVDKKLNIIQNRVCNTIRAWIESYWIEKYDDICLDELHHFTTNEIMDSQPAHAQRILELVSKRVNSDVYGLPPSTPKLKRILKPDEYQQPILPKSLKRFHLIDLDPLETARQLTLIEMAIFMKITPSELMKQEWSKKNGTSTAINVKAMTTMSTRITGWIISTILQEGDLKRRALMLKYFIKVGERCLMLNNFNTLMAIQSAFNSSTINRLKKTWELQSAKTKGILELLSKSTDHARNYSDYRAALRKSALPCLPFLGLFLTDLTFTDDGNPDFRNNNKLINFDKHVKTAKIITDLMHYQTPYVLAEVPEIQEFLLHHINERGTRDPQELYDLSLRLEPREDKSAGVDSPDEINRELEAKIHMLQKAGML